MDRHLTVIMRVTLTMSMTVSIAAACHTRLQHDLYAAVLFVFERRIHLRSVLERNLVRNDERRVDLAILDTFHADNGCRSAAV